MAVSKQIIDWAKQTKFFIRESGEEAIPDELLVRAAVTFNMLVRRYGGAHDPGHLVMLNPDRLGLMETHNRTHAIAVIASNYVDHPPSTPERAELFSTSLDISDPTEFYKTPESPDGEVIRRIGTRENPVVITIRTDDPPS